VTSEQPDLRTHYDLLGLEAGASREAIEKRILELRILWRRRTISALSRESRRAAEDMMPGLEAASARWSDERARRERWWRDSGSRADGNR